MARPWLAPPRNADPLLDVIARSGATIGVDRNGAVAHLGLPVELAVAASLAGPELAWAILGRGTGHRWATCTTCGRTQLIATGQGHGCRLTPRCDGTVKVLANPKDPPPHPSGLTCARPGCGKPATHLTAGHEPICHLDLHHLAILKEHPPT